ncbi:MULTISPECIES: hypothetical protein [unclassified Nonomuraea]|uniref:hypothetical protein n=1 Tax=unclassified Nonomuraea TaxID=2593643 RepID=UPI0033CEF5AB
MRMTVQDVMTTDVAAVNQQACFRTFADLLIGKAVSGMPVHGELTWKHGDVLEVPMWGGAPASPP